MKKTIFICLTSAVFLMSCGDTSTSNEPQVKTIVPAEGTTRQPVTTPDGKPTGELVETLMPDADVAEFFAKEMGDKISERSPNFLTAANKELEACVLVNSMDELRAVYDGDAKLPEIDFSDKTLIVGFRWTAANAQRLEKQELRLQEDGSYTMYLFCPIYQGAVTSNILFCNYWGLYPKIETQSISTFVVDMESGKVLY